MRPSADVSELLTKREAAKVRQGEAQLKAGHSKPWQAIKHDLGSWSDTVDARKSTDPLCDFEPERSIISFRHMPGAHVSLTGC